MCATVGSYELMSMTMNIEMKIEMGGKAVEMCIEVKIGMEMRVVIGMVMGWRRRPRWEWRRSK